MTRLRLVVLIQNGIFEKIPEKRSDVSLKWGDEDGGWQGAPALLTAETRRGVEIQDIPGRIIGALQDQRQQSLPGSIRLDYCVARDRGGLLPEEKVAMGMTGVGRNGT